MDTALSDLSYEMNMEFMEFIENIYKENTIKIVDIFQAFTALNEHYINHDKFYVDKLEQRCLDLISTSVNNDDAKQSIEIYIKRSIDHYLGLYGITLNNSELDIFEYSDFLNALVYLYNVDIRFFYSLFSNFSLSLCFAFRADKMHLTNCYWIVLNSKWWLRSIHLDKESLREATLSYYN